MQYQNEYEKIKVKLKSENNLSDKEVKINCSSCNEELCVIKIVDESVDLTTYVVANCSCGDKSFEKLIRGRFYIGSPENSNILILDTAFTMNGDKNVAIVDTLKVLKNGNK